MVADCAAMNLRVTGAAGCPLIVTAGAAVCGLQRDGHEGCTGQDKALVQ